MGNNMTYVELIDAMSKVLIRKHVNALLDAIEEKFENMFPFSYENEDYDFGWNSSIQRWVVHVNDPRGYGFTVCL